MKKINIAEKSFNPFDLIGQKWMLISAGTEDKWYGDHDYHTMYIGEIVAAYEN